MLLPARLAHRYVKSINMDDNDQDIEFVVASDVSERDGIGVEIYKSGEMILEIFRDDTKREREVTLYKKDVPLSLVEKSIEIFKREIPWEFIDYDEPS